MAALVDKGPRALDRPLDHRAQEKGLLPKLDLSARDARDVEQVIDQPGHVLDLSLHDLARPRDAVWLALVDAHDLQCGRHRRQRVSELVPEHREELIFAAIDLGELVDLAPKRSLERRPLLALRLERGRLLLERGDDAVALVRLDDAVALGRRDPGVCRVYLREGLGVSRIIEMRDRIRAEKSERLPTSEVVPELLEPDRRLAVSRRPEQRDHP